MDLLLVKVVIIATCFSPTKRHRQAGIMSVLTLLCLSCTHNGMATLRLKFTSCSPTEKDEMGRTCGAYGGEKRGAQGVGGET
jgi:hypothetical protein